jgi:hypothetical protein
MKYPGQIFIFSILKTFTKIFFLTFCLSVNPQFVRAQFQENFDDGDFTKNPTWTGSTADFVVSSGVLQLNAAPVSGSRYLSTTLSDIQDISWELSINMFFNPSSSNFTRIYLVSDQEDLNADLNGYFVMVGNSSDEVSLYVQKGETKTKIIDGLDGRVNSDEVLLKIKISRTRNGDWELFSDAGISGSYVQEGRVNDITHSGAGYMGFQCVYTSTRCDKFFFDDFIIQVLADTILPQVNSILVLSRNELEISFSENLDPVSAQTIENYRVDGTPGNPIAANLKSDLKTVHLIFDQDFSPNVAQSLKIENIQDLSFNVMNAFNGQFTFSPPVVISFKDVVVSELMPDPFPEVGLPGVEFAELLNTTNATLNLSGWVLTDGASVATFPSFDLLPGERVIVTASGNVELFNVYGNVIGVSNFPSLNNTGDNVILKTPGNLTVDSIYYSDSWYKDSEKKEGGWSLEIIDPDNLCGNENNWIASEDENGGTPGKINSVDAENLDLTGPEIVYAYTSAPDTIRLVFNEALGSEIPGVEKFLLEDFDVISVFKCSAKELGVVVYPTLDIGRIFNLTMEGITDCSGNLISENSKKVQVIIPENADSLDIVINEILFNPRVTGIDFVELYNASEKYVDLKGWSISNLDDGRVSNQKIITHESIMMYPGSYLAFSSSPETILSEYSHAPKDPNKQSELPPFNDDSGSVAIINPQGKVWDLFDYSEGMHSIFLKDKEGVSLERISPNAETNSAENWKSSSGNNGYATPGLKNSNAAKSGEFEKEVSVVPEIFIPEFGQPDFTRIQYSFKNAGNVASVKIFDSRGRLIKIIADNLILGTEGFIRWDGDRDNGMRAQVGSYMILFQVYDAEGEVRNIRKRVAIAGKF